jgi:hypothetical protein
MSTFKISNKCVFLNSLHFMRYSQNYTKQLLELKTYELSYHMFTRDTGPNDHNIYFAFGKFIYQKAFI